MIMAIKRCKLCRKIQGQLIQFFVAGVTARTAAELVGVSRPTATLYYQKIRQVICYHLELESEEYFAGEVELDESYFGGTRKGKRGRGRRVRSSSLRIRLCLVFNEYVAPALRLWWHLEARWKSLYKGD
jgi:transposase